MKIKRHLYWVIPVFLFIVVFGWMSSKDVNEGGFNRSGFGELPVLHNGRFKPFDTVARVSLLMIQGKQSVRYENKKLSAIEWLLIVLSDREKANKIPVFLIHDPDIKGLVDPKGNDKKKHFSFNDLGPSVSQILFQAQLAEKVEKPRRSRFQNAIFNLHQRMSLYHRLRSSLNVSERPIDEELQEYGDVIKVVFPVIQAGIPPGHPALEDDKFKKLMTFFQTYKAQSELAPFKAYPPLPGQPMDQWANLGEGLMMSLKWGAVRSDLAEYPRLLTQYRMGKVDAFNSTVSELIAMRRELTPEATRISKSEALFNKTQPFYLGMIFYLLAFLAGCFSWIKYREPLRKSSFSFLAIAFFIHSAGLAIRIFLQGRPPVTNLYSSAVFVGWGAVLMGFVLEYYHRKGFVTVLSAVMGFCSLVIAHHLSLTGDTLEMMQAVLDSNFWLATHVITITIGYSSTYLAGALGIFYLLQKFFKKMSVKSGVSLYRMTYGVVCFSLLLSFIGTVLGGIWADQSWGRFWGWDPKENGALLIVLWNAIMLHARLAGKIHEIGFIRMAVLGTIITSFSWFGVNMLGIGLHSYGFMDKAFFWLVLFSLSQVGVVALSFKKKPA